MTNTKHNLIHSTYYGDDCIFLLEDLTNKITPLSVEEKEAYIRSGGNYAEVISKEDSFDDHIIEIFKELTLTHAYQIADYVGIICNHLYKKYGNDMVFVSLARAGSPVGVLMKRYMLWRYGSDIAHYSISIVRDRGIDENALDDIRNQHPEKELCFIDGWTGRGSITFELKKAVEQYNLALCSFKFRFDRFNGSGTFIKNRSNKKRYLSTKCMFKFYDLWISQSYNFPERQKQRILSWRDFLKRIQESGLYQLVHSEDFQKIS